MPTIKVIDDEPSKRLPTLREMSRANSEVSMSTSEGESSRREQSHNRNSVVSVDSLKSSGSKRDSIASDSNDSVRERSRKLASEMSKKALRKVSMVSDRGRSSPSSLESSLSSSQVWFLDVHSVHSCRLKSCSA